MKKRTILLLLAFVSIVVIGNCLYYISRLNNNTTSSSRVYPSNVYSLQRFLRLDEKTIKSEMQYTKWQLLNVETFNNSGEIYEIKKVFIESEKEFWSQLQVYFLNGIVYQIDANNFRKFSSSPTRNDLELFYYEYVSWPKSTIESDPVLIINYKNSESSQTIHIQDNELSLEIIRLSSGGY